MLTSLTPEGKQVNISKKPLQYTLVWKEGDGEIEGQSESDRQTQKDGMVGS